MQQNTTFGVKNKKKVIVSGVFFLITGMEEGAWPRLTNVELRTMQRPRAQRILQARGLSRDAPQSALWWPTLADLVEPLEWIDGTLDDAAVKITAQSFGGKHACWHVIEKHTPRTKIHILYAPMWRFVVKASLLLLPLCDEYARSSTDQYTVVPVGGGHHSFGVDRYGTTQDLVHEYCNILNERGYDTFVEARRRYHAGEIKDTLDEYAIRYQRSGYLAKPLWNWNWNEELDGKREEAWNNAVITGLATKRNEIMQTSICVFITKEWCLTISGSIYKLLNEKI